jgi:hypothetical protein
VRQRGAKRNQRGTSMAVALQTAGGRGHLAAAVARVGAAIPRLLRRPFLLIVAEQAGLRNAASSPVRHRTPSRVGRRSPGARAVRCVTTAAARPPTIGFLGMHTRTRTGPNNNKHDGRPYWNDAFSSSSAHTKPEQSSTRALRP